MLINLEFKLNKIIQLKKADRKVAFDLLNK
jgi:hypothetical protein